MAELQDGRMAELQDGRIALIDYGAGNLTSVRKALTAVGASLFVPAKPADVERAAAIVVPGVGHFDATRALDATWVEAILARVGEGRPLLGICLGMQWLFEGSDESDRATGLGIFEGRCGRLSGDVKVPHVGWNVLARTGLPSCLLEGLPGDAYAYFSHTFAPRISRDTVATTTHGVAFASVVERGRVFGTQWHPEMSGRTGARVLENFLRLAAASC